MKPILVGESNPYGGDDGYALWPEPAGCAGWRLCHDIFGLSKMEYLRRFERANLLRGDGWSAPGARAAARALMEGRDYSGTYVLLGRRVQRAFGFDDPAPFTYRLPDPKNPHHRARVFFLPHPSGRCRAWGEPGAVARARELLPLILVEQAEVAA